MRIVSYCLMSNHWHLVVWPKNDGDLGAFMQGGENKGTFYIFSNQCRPSRSLLWSSAPGHWEFLSGWPKTRLTDYCTSVYDSSRVPRDSFRL
jgi:hypothetical protein